MSENETHRWYYQLPGNFYANGPTTGYYSTEEEVREALPWLPEEASVWVAVPWW